MLTLFENITETITDFERDTLIPMLIDTLSTSHEENRMRGKHLSGWLKASGQSVSEARIRKMVNYIRVTNAFKDKVLIGCSTGYFLTKDVHTVDKQIESLEGRIDSMKAVIDSLKAQRLSLKRAS